LPAATPHFNIACYERQLGNLETTKDFGDRLNWNRSIGSEH